MNILFVVSHPDDEALGAGASIGKFLKDGHKVAVATLCTFPAARSNISKTLLDDHDRALEVLGVTKAYGANFPNIKLNTVPHLEVVQFIENCIEDFGAEWVITHHPGDTNIDHVETSHAAQAACRLYQRGKDGVPPLTMFAYMEIPSSTEWSLAEPANRFNPNFFIEVGPEGVELKVRALKEYRGVMHEYPHPRSKKSIEALALYRGAQSGCNYAEAFEIAFSRM